MEIKTGKAHPESDIPAVEVPPDRSRPARRKATQKPQRTRNLADRIFALFKVMVGISVIALLVLGGFAAFRYAYTTDLLRLRTISVEGCRHTDSKKIEALIRQDSPANLLRIDLVQLRARLEREPWIRRAELRRILPETLKITIKERVPSIIAEIGGELQLLDNEGILLDGYGPSYGKLDVPVISGFKGDDPEAYRVLQEENSARVKVAVEVLTELASGPPELTRAISEIDLADTSNVKVLLLDDTAQVYLGDHDFLKRFQAFMTNRAEYEELKTQGKEVDSVDLRFDTQIVYHLRHTAAAEQAVPKTNVVRN